MGNAASTSRTVLSWALCALIAVGLVFAQTPLAYADAAESVKYVDENHAAQTFKGKVTHVTATTDADWDAGFYIVDKSVTVKDAVNAKGDVKLVLGDGATLTLAKGATIADKGKLTVYAQDKGTGALVVNGSGIAVEKGKTATVAIDGAAVTVTASAAAFGTGCTVNVAKGLKVTSGKDAKSAAAVAVAKRDAKTYQNAYVRIEACAKHEAKGGTCTQCGAVVKAEEKKGSSIKPMAAHTVTFMVDGEAYGEPLSLEQGAKIEVPEKAPEKEGYKFDIWTGGPEDFVMGDEDVTYTASFTKIEYAAKWSWSNHQPTCTLSADGVDDVVLDSSKITVTSEETTKATCEKDGVKTYTGKVTYGGTEYTDSSDTETVKALGHKWGKPTFKWAKGNKSATATFTCTNDKSHTKTVDAKVTSKTTKKATTKADGTTTYTATATLDGKSYTDTKTATVPAIASYAFTVSNYSWTRASGRSLSMTIKRGAHDNLTYNQFEGLKIDGKTVATSYYTKKAGSVVLTVKPAYLAKLTTGRHTVTAQFADGDDAKSTLTIRAANSSTAKKASSLLRKSKTNPKTGDSLFAIGVPVVIAIVAVVLVILLRRARRRA